MSVSLSTLSDGDLRWAVEAASLRRGGFRERKNARNADGEIDTIVRELRLENAKTIGEQHIASANPTASQIPVAGKSPLAVSNVGPTACDVLGFPATTALPVSDIMCTEERL